MSTTALFTATDAASGAAVLRGPLPLNRVCLHMGPHNLFGPEHLAHELSRLNVREGFVIQDPFTDQRIYIRREA